MNCIAPNHVADYCCKKTTDSVYNKLVKEYANDFSYVYKIKCECGSEKFSVFKNAQPSIFAVCQCCGKKITIYDLYSYPAAVALEGSFEYKQQEESMCDVYVNYEYSDEYLYEDDVDFDQNDVSWARVFLSNGEAVYQILDDETA